MGLSATAVATYASVGGLLLYIASRAWSARPPAPLPPGPKGLPLIGNLLDWPREREWETLTRWGQLYGDITYINLVGQRMVVLNSAAQARALLERKGALYASRPSFYVACELLGWKRSPAFAPYGAPLRTMRRMMGSAIGGRAAVARLAPMQEREARKFVRRVLGAPAAQHLFPHVRKLASAVIFSASHGYQVGEGADPMVALAERVMADIDRVLHPGAFLVDMFPILDRLPSWCPGTGFRKAVAEMKKTATDSVEVPHAWVKAQLAQGTALPSFVSSQMEGRELSAEDEELVKFVAGSYYGAGSETTVALLTSFFLTMTLHPEVQARARAELDAVVGADRLPSLADRDSLPYTEAVCSEVLRWAPPVPLGLPHALTADDIHDGYFIARGTYAVANIWGLTHDARTYADPATFDPARFVPADGRAPEQDPRDFVFGFGRRICPGALLAGATFFIAVATTLALWRLARL